MNIKENAKINNLELTEQQIKEVDELIKQVDELIKQFEDKFEREGDRLPTIGFGNPNLLKIGEVGYFPEQFLSELFAKAWIYGYEIEQEKLYMVEIADAILTKITRGRNIQYKMLPSEDVSAFFDKAIYTTKLTETEIKQKDERLWQFVKDAEDE